MTTTPLVSIGVASFNNAPYIRETLDSIRALNYPNVELIIIDDVSTDNSVAVIEGWLREHADFNARLIRHPHNQGLCRVCNRFVEEAKGKYLSLIGSDDIYLSDKLTVQVAILEAAPPEVGVVFSDISKIDSQGRILVSAVYGSNQVVPHAGWVWLSLLRLNYIQTMGTLVRKSCYEVVGPFDESLSFEDWDMWLRIARHFQFLYHPGITAQYRIHNGSATFRRRAQMAESCLLLLQKQLGVSGEGDRIIADHTASYAETLYFLDSPACVYWLTRRWQLRRDSRSMALLVLAKLNIPARRMSQLYRVVKSLKK